MFNKSKLALAVQLSLVLGSLATVTTTSAQDTNTAEAAVEKIAVTGSRIKSLDQVANSPMLTVNADELNSRADITIDTYMNTLPQVNPAGTTTSNNPGNGGQSNIDLRGLGANRNLVLVDGRRVMVSSSAMTVDLNTIPAAMIDSIEVITGGAGAAYGADAVAGAVNLRLKSNFEGVDFRATHSNHAQERDAEEYNFSAVVGGNFDDSRGNAIIAFDYSKREGMIKSQREFSANATSTTSFFPEGRYFSSGNHPSQAAVDAVFASYGSAAGSVPANGSLIGFNTDGSLFSAGVFNNPLDVENWRYPVDLSVNGPLFPDVYSYNFDAVNILVLPLERKTFSSKLNFDVTDKTEVFATASWTNYNSETALAPTPFPTVQVQGPDGTVSTRATSAFVSPGSIIANQLIIPVTNPFIPADMMTLLNSRTGDNAALVGSGATEPFLMRQRSLWGGLRGSQRDNTVVQYMLGIRGEINDAWSYDVYAMEGKTTIKQTQTGNLDTQRVMDLLAAPDGGASICAGGYNPFGRNSVSQECADYITLDASLSREFNQRIMQGFVSGDLLELPSGMLSVVLGYESRRFDYNLDPGSLSGPVSGFNTQNPAAGKNRFDDIFAEAFIPLLDGRDFADSLDLTLGFRSSQSQFTDIAKGISGDKDRNSAYKAELSWVIASDLPRIRASYQRAVRAPNFGELFDSSGSAPQYFDPCSVSTEFRAANGQAGADLCSATGVGAPDSYVQTPGTQASINTSGNVQLKPETADTFTLGAVHNFSNGLAMSLDYYNIDIEDAIITPNVNLIIADCYNYYGNNATLSGDYSSCQYIVRGGGDISRLADPNTADGNIPGINSGFIKTSGLDFQAGYGFDTDILGGAYIKLGLYANYLLEYKTQELDFLPAIDYADTVAYFGAGLGQSFPKFKVNLNASVNFGDLEWALKGRYIDGMKNRLAVEMPIETQPSGTSGIMYWDTTFTYRIGEHYSVRLGVNNLLDTEPELYAPNVQSGTDPSLYDVVGRRVTLSASVKF
ncbi:MAG: TonB-dependent receptor [Gammaproteobacteria bacterium]|nr:TonB-dependent receptor [Gammaproteobacteria bacterium]MBU1555452.1 TonB-dependent receptor [Gammaproteobacteria bacterium]MBU2070907.1 TonB-dependent receptor [Gammaproteobacteria bacterium]MBU2183423.1 TonB-dependent receptor [Gammaproteobacteria bacterium]MBU2204113.1 TonB-dependent receptor [Gammaproteobacteria bacterium]